MDVPCYTQPVPDLNGPAAALGPPDPEGGPVKRAIREHLRDFVAIAVLVVLALVTTGVILAQQQPSFPSWVPILGQDHFELKAEFTTAQAVTPGTGADSDHRRDQGRQRVQASNLESGRAVVTMDDRQQVRRRSSTPTPLCCCGRAPGSRT